MGSCIAVGKAGFVTANMVKQDAIVIDVGINRNREGKLIGDVCFDDVVRKADAITLCVDARGQRKLNKNAMHILSCHKLTDRIDIGIHLESKATLVDKGRESEFMYAEVEFPSVQAAESFEPLPCFTADVTKDSSYKMKNFWKRTRS